MAINDEQGFLDNDINVQSDFGLGEQSVLLTPEDIKPSQPYQITRVQETIPAAPPIGVGGKFDPYSTNDLNTIISPFTDAEAIKERRKKEKRLRGQIKTYGDVAPLFAETPSLDITTPEIPVIKSLETPDPTINTPSLGVKPELVRQKEFYDSGAIFNEPFFVDDKSVAKDIEDFYNTAGTTYAAVDGIKGLIEMGGDAYDAVGDAYKYFFPDSVSQNIGSYGGLTDPNFAPPQMGYATPSLTGIGSAAPTGFAGTGYGSIAPTSQGYQYLGRGTGMNVPGGTSQGAAQLGKYMGYAGTALSAYSAFDAFKQGDMLGGAAGTAQTLLGLQSIGMIGAIPGLQTVAIALTALNFVSSITGWGRGKPKPGFGGSEIGLRQDGTFFHDQAYSYNGFDPSGAKKHTDMAMKFLTNYEKELGLKINYDRAQEAIRGAKVRGGNYLRRVDVSPWKDGSGSASEMIERWLSAGVYDGTPTYYDAYTGQREAFQTQQQYEQWMENFSHRMFS